MTSSKDNLDRQDKNSASNPQDKNIPSENQNKKRERVPKFEEKDMYRIKYNF
jgi:hypothetical protein